MHLYFHFMVNRSVLYFCWETNEIKPIKRHVPSKSSALYCHLVVKGCNSSTR